MITRRDLLVGALSAAGAGVTRSTLAATASQPATRVGFAVPAGACDCHTHVFGDPTHFPFTFSRTYTPETASIGELNALHRALHIDRVVIVQPSVYGTDNACTVDAIRQLGGRARGVAVIDDSTSDAALDQMHRVGVRGIRINLATAGEADPAVARQRLQSAMSRIARYKWHVQMYTDLSVIEGIKDLVAAATVPVVFDHFGGASATGGTGQPGFATLVDLVRSGKAYVKVSAPYRSSDLGPDYVEMTPFARALIEANAQRILWGSDWPHPNPPPPPGGRRPQDIAPFYQVDDGRLLNQLAAWVPDPARRQTILVANPARLYGF